MILLKDLGIRPSWRVAVLGPHPDDFDAIGVTMRFLHRNGNPLAVGVVTGGERGVPDGFGGATTKEEKRAIREAEQRESCARFGLGERQLTFLRTSDLTRDEATARVRSFLAEARPDLVFLPHGNDSNAAHRATWALLRGIVAAAEWRLHAFLAHDPKTIAMRHDVLTPFDREEAEWKAALLRCHRSQQARNMDSRGRGVDDRVLDLNRRVAAEARLPEEFAEAFEVAALGDPYPS